MYVTVTCVCPTWLSADDHCSLSTDMTSRGVRTISMEIPAEEKQEVSQGDTLSVVCLESVFPFHYKENSPSWSKYRWINSRSVFSNKSSNIAWIMLQDLVCIKNSQNCSNLLTIWNIMTWMDLVALWSPYWGPMVTCIEYYLDIYF